MNKLNSPNVNYFKIPKASRAAKNALVGCVFEASAIDTV